MKIRLVIVALALLSQGCSRQRPSADPPVHLVQNMDDQPRYKPQAESKFFADGRAMRLPVEGTVARGFLRADSSFYYEGKDEAGNFLREAPLAVTLDRLERGRERYDIFCAPCHGRSGSGQGAVAKRGLVPPASFHDERLRGMEDGRLYDIISNGLRNMPPHKYQIPTADRWAIVVYLRALQRSQKGTEEDVPTGMLPAHQ